MTKLILKNGSLIVLENLEVADSFLKRFFGLLFKPCPKLTEGLIFYNCSAIHMFFMRYSIGVLFMDSNGSAMKIIDTLKPWRIASCQGASTTIETAPGLWSKCNIKVGDQLILVSEK